jgi:hypothetical protein
MVIRMAMIQSDDQNDDLIDDQNDDQASYQVITVHQEW